MTIYKKIIILFLSVLAVLVSSFGIRLYLDTTNPKDAPRSRYLIPILTMYTEILDTKELKERQEMYENLKSPIFRVSEDIASTIEQNYIDKIIIRSKKFPDRFYKIEYPGPPFIFILTTYIVVFIVLLIFINYFLKRTLKPIDDMTIVMNRVATGDYSIRMNTRLNDPELRLLSNGFNQMAHKIEIGKKNDQLLLRSISHELRSPIASLFFLYEIINDQKNFKRYNEIGDGLHILEKTLNDIDLIANGVLKGEPPEIYNFNIRSFLFEYIQETSTFLLDQNKNYLFIDMNNEKHLEINGNENYARIIIKNLIQNEVSYGIAESSVEIQLREELGFCIISFPLSNPVNADSESFFTLFYRGRSANLSYPEGKGLGLAITRSLCETIGWSIQYENKSFVLRIKV